MDVPSPVSRLGGEGRGGEGTRSRAALCPGWGQLGEGRTSAPPPKAGKSLSLSITLLRINFVEIKIGLGINSASRIFSGILEAAEGSDSHSQS